MKQSMHRCARWAPILLTSVLGCADSVEATDMSGINESSDATASGSRDSASGSQTTTRGKAAGGSSSIFGSSFGATQNAKSLPNAAETKDGSLLVSAEKAAEALKDPEAACQGWSVEAEAEGSTILFLLDVSGSMLESAPSTGGESKWQVTRAALRSAIERLPNSVGLGISFFPNMEIVSETNSMRPVDACVDSSRDVPLELASTAQRAAVLRALDEIEPYQKAATPTHDALNRAFEQLKRSSLSGRRYLVFITDGQPTQSQGCLGTGIMCTPSPVDPILDTISSAYSDAQINTFVVGSPGSERNYCTDADVRGWLSQAARLGNTASAECKDDAAPYCHFDLSAANDFGAAMSGALSEITKAIISCNYTVPRPTNGGELDPTRVSMIFNNGAGEYYLLLPNSGEVCDKGWSYTDSSNSKVEICGTTCTLLQDDPNARLSILFGCRGGDILIL